MRRLPVLTGRAPEFDPAQAPDDPVELFIEWLWLAIDSGIDELHAMTLSTVNSRSQPSVRVLILKDVDALVPKTAVAVNFQQRLAH